MYENIDELIDELTLSEEIYKRTKYINETITTHVKAHVPGCHAPGDRQLRS